MLLCSLNRVDLTQLTDSKRRTTKPLILHSTTCPFLCYQRHRATTAWKLPLLSSSACSLFSSHHKTTLVKRKIPESKPPKASKVRRNRFTFIQTPLSFSSLNLQFHFWIIVTLLGLAVSEYKINVDSCLSAQRTKTLILSAGVKITCVT